MKLPYQKLWVKLAELEMKKTQLAKNSGTNTASLVTHGNGANIIMDVLLIICEYLNCELDEIARLYRTKRKVKKK